MTIPTYTFRLRDAARRDEAKIFVDLLLSTGRFYRNEKSQILFKIAPGDSCLIERKQGLSEILSDGDVVRVDGDIGPACEDCLWMWLTARKHTLPRLNPYTAYNPPAPKPVAHVRPEERYVQGRDCAPLSLPVRK